MGSLISEARVARLQRLTAYLEEYWEEHWTSPTVREIMEHMGWTSPSTAYNFLHNAERDHFIQIKRVSRQRVLYRPTPPVRFEGWRHVQNGADGRT